jgi:23S rRNA (adenine2503-C2)-methyltransferase
VLRWLHQFGEDDFERMSDVAKSLRAKLAELAEVRLPQVLRDATAADGTRKWLLDVGNGNAVECVFIPEENRGTLCISTQAGCALDCAFCSTGKQGFNRNLTTGEIIGQLWWAKKALGDFRAPAAQGIAVPRRLTFAAERVISNVVLMGMGEPLANYENVLAALRLMLDDNAYGLSRRRVTVSTSGIVPAIDRLRDECPVALAVSLHAPERRPARPAGADQPKISAGRIDGGLPPLPGEVAARFHHLRVRHAGWRQRFEEHARELIRLVHEVPCKFNLIPFNPFPASGFKRSPALRVRRFAEILMQAHIVTTTRKTRGEDIDAACGQLAGQVRDRTRRRDQTHHHHCGGSIVKRAILIVCAFLVAGCAGGGGGPAGRDRPASGFRTGPGRLRREERQDAYRTGHPVPAVRQPGRCLEEARIAAAVDPNYAPAYNLMGLVHVLLNESAQAQAALSNAPSSWRRATRKSPTTTAGFSARTGASRKPSSISLRPPAIRSTGRRPSPIPMPACATCVSRTTSWPRRISSAPSGHGRRQRPGDLSSVQLAFRRGDFFSARKYLGRTASAD